MQTCEGARRSSYWHLWHLFCFAEVLHTDCEMFLHNGTNYLHLLSVCVIPLSFGKCISSELQCCLSDYHCPLACFPSRLQSPWVCLNSTVNSSERLDCCPFFRNWTENPSFCLLPELLLHILLRKLYIVIYCRLLNSILQNCWTHCTHEQHAHSIHTCVPTRIVTRLHAIAEPLIYQPNFEVKLPSLPFLSSKPKLVWIAVKTSRTLGSLDTHLKFPWQFQGYALRRDANNLLE